MVNEVWKNIKEYPNYMVSNFGNVKSLCNNKTRKEKILKNGKDVGGYLQVILYKNGKSKHYQVHRLVAEAFIDNTDNKPCIDHINTDRTDNRVCNLRWVTYKENSDNPITKVKHHKKLKENLSKPIIQFTKNGEFIRKWDCIRDVQRELGINNGNICSCCNGKRETAGGYIWRYTN